mgnify:CR=1 FL=1
METTKEEIFKITYNEKLDKLQIQNHNVLKKIAKNIKRHKIITTSIIALIAFSMINTIMIYNFLQILLRIWKIHTNMV